MSRFLALPGVLSDEMSVEPKTLGIALTLLGLAVFVYNIFDPAWRYRSDAYNVRMGLAIGAVLMVGGLFAYFRSPKP